MTREGDRGPTAPYSWRLRLSIGLVVLAGLAVLLGGGGTGPASRAVVGAFARLRTTERGVSRVWLAEAGALALLGRAALRRRSPQAAPPDAPPPRGAPDPVRARRSSRPPAPGDARELLALFALPRPDEAGGGSSPEAPAGGLPAASEPGEPAPAAGLSGERLPLIRLYGALAVEGSDGSGLGRRATRGLVAYLALRRGEASFDELLEALWPGEDAAKARPRLWKAKRHAQPLLRGALVRRGAGYALEAARVGIDVVEIERLSGAGAGLAALERAASLSTGAPLADLDYPWAESERRRLDAIRADVLARVSRERLRAGEARAALGAAEELVRHDPLNELGWRLAMEAEAVLGARQAVIDRYRLLDAELDRRLGLRPQSETRATYRRLLGQH